VPVLRSLNFFLKVVHHGMGPQEAIDFPSFSSSHFPSSFGGSAQPLVLGLEGRLPAATAARLEALGHKVPWGVDASTSLKRAQL
jgi:gamma-glutamyltranspeptidase/glutathione hydrolase